jgi:hypothetical protein
VKADRRGIPVSTMIAAPAATGDHAGLIQRLRALVEALDRRVPHLEREGETEICDEAAALRRMAVARIAQLEATL